jgi:hypothetical protein
MPSIKLHPGQSRVFKDVMVDGKYRYGVVCAARGWGKSYFAGTTALQAVQELVNMPADVPNKNVAIIAPTYQQVVDIYYPLLAWQLGLEDFAVKHSRSAGQFWLPNNVMLKLWSYEASERMRGTGQYLVILDEVCSWKGAGTNLKESWESVIEPCVTTRWSPMMQKKWNSPFPGRAIVISTPRGHDYFYEMFNRKENDNAWGSYHFNYRQSPYLDPDEIQRAKMTLDPLKFAREYEASFKDSGNNLFYMFNRNDHVDSALPDIQKGEDVHVAMDFNIGIMASAIGARRGNQTHWLHELSGHPDTDSVAKSLVSKYVKNGHKVIVYPDPTGKSRKTSASGETDFSILRKAGLTVRVREASPAIIDSTNAVNAQLKNANGDVNMYFHPRMLNTVRSMERTSWLENNPDTAQINKTEGVEHWSDAIRYYTEYNYPIRSGSVGVVKTSTF